MENTTSVAKVEANKRNAMRSTGPKSVSGKQAVRWNAVKHGLLAREVVIRAGDGKENQSQFDALLASLVADLKPVGVLEEMLVERIALSYWRLRRVVRCETGEIRAVLDTLCFDDEVNRIDTAQRILDYALPDRSGCEKLLLRSTSGIRLLRNIVAELREFVEAKAPLSPKAKVDLLRLYGGREEDLGVMLLFFSHAAENPSRSRPVHNEEPLPDAETCRKTFLDILAGKEKSYNNIEEWVKEYEELHAETESARHSLPVGDSADRITRYETAIERQLYRAMRELDRLQMKRRGETATPHIVIEDNR